MPELTKEQKEIVVKFCRDWPKSVDSRKLVELLDKFAKEIIETTIYITFKNPLEN